MLRLEHEGWVASRWEDIDPQAEKRPARRYYRLTAGGAAVRSYLLSAPRLAVMLWARTVLRRARPGPRRRGDSRWVLLPKD